MRRIAVIALLAALTAPGCAIFKRGDREVLRPPAPPETEERAPAPPPALELTAEEVEELREAIERLESLIQYTDGLAETTVEWDPYPGDCVPIPGARSCDPEGIRVYWREVGGEWAIAGELPTEWVHVNPDTGAEVRVPVVGFAPVKYFDLPPGVQVEFMLRGFKGTDESENSDLVGLGWPTYCKASSREDVLVCLGAP